MLITLFSVFTISDVVAYTSNTSAPGQNHRSLGYALTYLCISIVGLGFLSKASMLWWRYLTLWMKYVRFAHSSIGYIVIFYSQYVILSGLYAFQVSTRNLYFIQIIAIILCFLIIEITFCLINKKYYKAFIKINKKNLKTMSLKAFNESNKKLALFNDYVVDLTSYAYEHPGGTFVIQQWNKKDIGKYIYGAYSMEDNVSPHKHSFIAMKIVERLIWARIVPERQFDNEIESRRSVARFEDSQQFIEASIWNIKRSSCYKIGKWVNFQNNLYRVVFEDTIDSDHYIFREGLGFIGKHYVVVSEKNQVARYYTICQTFHSKVYKQYLDAFDNVLTGKKFERKFETIEQISNETSNSIELFMKFYTQSKNGITKQISSAAQEDRFIVSGIFGKGLNLEKQNIVGSNLIVVGGTGILPFIDLFAYLARRLISKKAEMSQVFFREVCSFYKVTLPDSPVRGSLFLKNVCTLFS